MASFSYNCYSAMFYIHNIENRNLAWTVCSTCNSHLKQSLPRKFFKSHFIHLPLRQLHFSARTEAHSSGKRKNASTLNSKTDQTKSKKRSHMAPVESNSLPSLSTTLEVDQVQKEITHFPISDYLKIRLKLLNDTCKISEIKQTIGRTSKRVMNHALKKDYHINKHTFMFTIQEEIEIIEYMLRSGVIRISKSLIKSLRYPPHRIHYFWDNFIIPALYTDQANCKKANMPATAITLRALLQRRLSALCAIDKFMKANPSQKVFDTLKLPQNIAQYPIIRVGRLGSHLYTAHFRMPWTLEQDTILLKCVADFGPCYRFFLADLPGQSRLRIRKRHMYLVARSKNAKLKKWTEKDHERLISLVHDTPETNYSWKSMCHNFPGMSSEVIRKKALKLVFPIKTLKPDDIKVISDGVANHGRAYFNFNLYLDLPGVRMKKALLVWTLKEPHNHPNALWSSEDDKVLMSVFTKYSSLDDFKPVSLISLRREYFPFRYTFELAARLYRLINRNSEIPDLKLLASHRDWSAQYLLNSNELMNSKNLPWINEALIHSMGMDQETAELRDTIVPKGHTLLAKINANMYRNGIMSKIRSVPMAKEIMLKSKDKAWTKEDDCLMMDHVPKMISKHGYVDWAVVSKLFPASSLSSCRQRWHYLEAKNKAK
ncbi:myb-like DNA-binding protein bas1 [Batrachochytrium dendrobatidis]|nr:myb-like DNA-binding protein bas1 [Batrachochytrium dendrobatidis]KAK5669526.1 myb-like DNA-binding protein bas1 [Batrachochytrium dendrobatidis]